MTEAELEVALQHLRAVAAIGTQFERQFARSIIARARNRNWQPSDKQTGVIRRIVAERTSAEIEVIENADSARL
jgi:hypothetical protein